VRWANIMVAEHQLATRRRSSGGIEEAVQEVVGLLRDVLERQYPHPLRFTHIRTPFDWDTVFADFTKPVSVPVLVSPDSEGLRFDVGTDWNTFIEANVEIDKRTVTGVTLYNRYWIGSFHDSIGIIGLTHLTSQRFADAVKKARVTSNGAGNRWLTELIVATEDVRNSEEAKALRPTDLLDTDYRTRGLTLVLREPFEDIHDVRLWLFTIPSENGGRGHETLNVEVFTTDGRSFEIFFRLDDGEVIDTELVRGGQACRNAIERLLSELTWKDLARSVEVATKEFLEDYKYFMVALSLLNLLS